MMIRASSRKLRQFRIRTITQFVVASASERAAEVIEQHRRVVLNEQSWSLVMEAITQPPAPNDRLKRAAKRLQTR